MVRMQVKEDGTDDLTESAISKIKSLPGFERVRFIILFGSRAEGNATSGSDIDLCIWYDGPDEEASRFRFSVLSELCDDRYDVHIFRELPLAAKAGVFRGRVLYSDDEDFVYATAYDTLREYEMFRHRLNDYTGQEAIT